MFVLLLLYLSYLLRNQFNLLLMMNFFVLFYYLFSYLCSIFTLLLTQVICRSQIYVCINFFSKVLVFIYLIIYKLDLHFLVMIAWYFLLIFWIEYDKKFCRRLLTIICFDKVFHIYHNHHKSSYWTTSFLNTCHYLSSVLTILKCMTASYNLCMSNVITFTFYT